MKFTTSVLALAVASTTEAFVQKSSSGRVSKTSIAGYLDALTPTATAPGISYLDGMPASSGRAGGAGLGSYLDNVNVACDGGAPTVCADAITEYMGALSTGQEPASSSAKGAEAIGNYLDFLAGGLDEAEAVFKSEMEQVQGSSSDAGMQSYTSTVAAAPARVGGPGLGNYLDGMKSSASSAIGQSAPAVKVSSFRYVWRW